MIYGTIILIQVCLKWQTDYRIIGVIYLKKAVALVLALVMCVCAVCSCADTGKNYAMTVPGGGNVSINFMYLLAAMQKTMYAEMVESYGGDWSAVVNSNTGETFSDMLYQITIKSGESSLACEYMHDNIYGLSLTDEQKASVDNQINSLISSVGSKANLEEKLSEYSADIDTLERYFELSLKQSNLYTLFYSEGGEFEITDEMIKDYFEDNYAIVTHIFFSTAPKQKADGTAVSLTEEEIAAKRSAAENVYNRILAGEDFYELKAQYSEDSYESEYYPNGFFVTADTTFPTEFTVAALEMKEGEYRLVESEGSGIHVMLKLPMDASLYNSDTSVYTLIREQLTAVDFEARVAENTDLVTRVEEQLALLNVDVVPEFSLG